MEFANGNRHVQPCPDCERSLIQQIHQNAKRQHHLYCRQWHQSLINHRSWHPQSLLRCRSSQHEMNTTFLNQRTTTGFHCSRCQPSLNATICCPSIDLHCLTAREATSSQPDEQVELCRTVSTGTFATTAAEHQELDSSGRTQVRKLKQVFTTVAEGLAILVPGPLAIVHWTYWANQIKWHVWPYRQLR